jgi:hypothetical protein
MNTKWPRYIARAGALLWAGWWTLFGLLSGIGEGLEPGGIFMHTLMPGLLFLALAVIAWRWEVPGGILLLLAGLWSLDMFWFARTPQGFLLLALPPLLAGLLLLIDWGWARTMRAPRAPGSHA